MKRSARPTADHAERPIFTPREWTVLATIVAIAAIYRLVALDRVPPGINQDEALSAWNAWCLLHTGRAMSGERWPIFHCRNIGDQPTMLFFYVLMPFQKLGGLNVLTTRLPVALAGILTVPLLAWIGARLFGAWVGLIAAALFAVAPWTTFIGRLGVGAGITPLQALLPIAALDLAGFPIGDRTRPRPNAGWAAVAGITAGLAGYGFHSLRIVMPLTLAGLLLVAPRRLRERARSIEGRRALFALAAGFAATFGPLAWESAADPAMMKRWEMTRLWPAGAGLGTIFGLVATRYLEHFGSGFLFLHGDTFGPFRPLGQGELGWYLLPGLIAGAGLGLAAARHSVSARTLIVLVLLYPAGDLVSRNNGPHLLRSAAGVASLLLLAAWGTVEGFRRLRRVHRRFAVAVAALMGICALAQESIYASRYFSDFPRVWQNQIDYQGALLEAARWVRPRLPATDAVIVSTTGATQPFVIFLVGLQYAPNEWFRDPREVQTDEFDRYLRVGKLYFNRDSSARPFVEAMEADPRAQRVLFVVRPHELGLSDPIHRILGPNGDEMFWICERRL
jgi:4-amino-4-deoxy-L-arabinose transferase-like glycosyltransferase